MTVFLLTLLILGLVIIGMSVGVILGNIRLKGSCGGLGKIMNEKCSFCENKECKSSNTSNM